MIEHFHFEIVYTFKRNTEMLRIKWYFNDNTSPESTIFNVFIISAERHMYSVEIQNAFSRKLM